jgi:hypothetical protein
MTAMQRLNELIHRRRRELIVVAAAAATYALTHQPL